MVTTLLIAQLSCLLPRPIQAYTAMDKFLEQWDIDIDDPDKDKHQLFDALRHKLKEAPHNVELFWRLVQASLVLASSYEKNDDKVEGKKYTEESVKWAKKAVEYGPNSMQAHKW